MKRLYLWQDMQGKRHILVAKSFTEAKRMLIQRQELFFKLKLKGYLTARSFKRQELIIITKQLATMLAAGLPIIETLTLLANNHPLPQWQWLLTDIKQHIMLGKTISQTVSYHADIFPSIYQEVIAIGELTGQLETCFERLAQQLDKTYQLQKRITKALRYPVFLLIVSIIVTLIMLLLVLPQFAQIYQNFDAQLPAFTQFIITMSVFVQHYAIYLVILSLLCGLIYRTFLKKRYYHQIEQLLFKMPLVGAIMLTANLAQIFQTLAITQKSGIPLLAGLITAQKTTYHQLFSQTLLQIRHEIEQGNTLSDAIKQYDIFPDFCFRLIRVGEESGTLDHTLTRLAEHYQQKNIEQTDNLSAKIEPIMMTIMALIIGSLVIAMYLPVFQLGSVIH